jgi:hypothetical protein
MWEAWSNTGFEQSAYQSYDETRQGDTPFGFDVSVDSRTGIFGLDYVLRSLPGESGGVDGR